jgi:beta-lactamase superfamily II metal-dependent hydrolase
MRSIWAIGIRWTLLCAGMILFLWTTAYADVVAPLDDVTSFVVVRQTASSQSPRVGSLRPGEQAELVGSVPYWHQVKLADGTPGFVSKRWTRVIPTAPPLGVTYTMDIVDVGTGLGILVRGPDFTLVYDGGSNDDLARGSDNRMLA